MASSDLSKSTGQLGVAPATYVCPKLAGSVAAGIVFLGVSVLLLIPRPDHGSPVIDEASLSNSAEPEVALSVPSPRIDPPNSLTPSTPAIAPLAEPKPNQTPPAEQDPVDPVPPSRAASPEEKDPAPEAEPALVEVKEPIERENVIQVLEGEIARTLGGDAFILRKTKEGSVTIELAAVSAPPAGTGRIAATGALVGLLDGQVSVQCIEEIGKKRWAGWVFAGGVDVNEAMIEGGFAWYDPRKIKSVALKELQEKARSAGLGIWKSGKTEPKFPEELQSIGTEVTDEGTPETSDDASTEGADAPDENEALPDKVKEEMVAAVTDSPTNTEQPKPADATTTPVEVDQSSPEKLIESFKAALKQNDLVTARGLLFSRPYGRARSFYADRLSDSALEALRIAFDGATILAMRPISRKLNVVMETSDGKKMQVVVVQVGSNWNIYSWDVPR